MKKILSLVLAVVLLCGCMLTLVACGGGLSGKYESGLTTYEFKGKNFTRTTSIGGFSYTAEGTYEITEEDDDQFITLTYTSGDDKAKEDEAGVALAFSKGEEDGVKYIKIGLRKYTQVK
ncbi:MAG: hypothetical protein J6J66_04630 [Clostridia bacterium]|nr:hypothetical protein [Clostridia bacterium]